MLTLDQVRRRFWRQPQAKTAADRLSQLWGWHLLCRARSPWPERLVVSLPTWLLTALEAFYGHYQKTFDLWLNAKVGAPPAFIIVCQNTAISKRVYDFVSGFERENDDGSSTYVPGPLELFRPAEAAEALLELATGGKP